MSSVSESLNEMLRLKNISEDLAVGYREAGYPRVERINSDIFVNGEIREVPFSWLHASIVREAYRNAVNLSESMPMLRKKKKLGELEITNSYFMRNYNLVREHSEKVVSGSRW